MVIQYLLADPTKKYYGAGDDARFAGAAAGAGVAPAGSGAGGGAGGLRGDSGGRTDASADDGRRVLRQRDDELRRVAVPPRTHRADLPSGAGNLRGPALVECSITPLDGCFLGTVDMPLPEKIETLRLPLGSETAELSVVRLPGISHIIVPAQVFTARGRRS